MKKDAGLLGKDTGNRAMEAERERQFTVTDSTWRENRDTEVKTVARPAVTSFPLTQDL